MTLPATSSTQPHKADSSKYAICQDQVKTLMLCVKTEDCVLVTIVFKSYTVLGDV